MKSATPLTRFIGTFLLSTGALLEVVDVPSDFERRTSELYTADNGAVVADIFVTAKSRNAAILMLENEFASFKAEVSGD